MSDAKDQLGALGALLDKVAKKQKVDKTESQLDQMLAILQDFEDTSEDDVFRARALAALESRLEAVGVEQSEQASSRELQSAIQKLGKFMDKTLPQRDESLAPVTLDDQHVLACVYVHLISSGQYNVAEVLEQEAQIDPSLTKLCAPLRSMHETVEALRRFDLEPALAWAREYQLDLEARGSPLPFLLARLAFVSCLERGEMNLALQIARDELMPLALRVSAARPVTIAAGGLLPPSYAMAPPGRGSQPSPSGLGNKAGAGSIPKAANGVSSASATQAGGFSLGGVRQLMGALAFAPALRGSPYEWLTQPRRIDEACELLAAEVHASLHLPLRSALSECVEAGECVLPKLAKLSSILGPKYAEAWATAAELPVELELPGRSGAHHSIFSCPVSKEPATPDNPPMLLPCGHVLASASLHKLARGSRSVRFKCPYCPVETTTSMAKVLHIS